MKAKGIWTEFIDKDVAQERGAGKKKGLGLEPKSHKFNTNLKLKVQKQVRGQILILPPSVKEFKTMIVLKYPEQNPQ